MAWIRVSVAGLVLCSGLAVGGPRDVVEVSADGHERASPGPSWSLPSGTRARSTTVPFGTTPDYELALRRQVGALEIADIDGDGLNDLVVGCYISNSFPPYDDWRDFILFGVSGVAGVTLETAPSWISGSQIHTGDLKVGDLDQDGRLDLLVVHGGSVGSSNIRVHYGRPNGVGSSLPELVASWQSVIPERTWGTAGVLTDLDNDGDLDVVTTGQGLSPDPFRPMLAFRNLGGTLTSSPVWRSAEQSLQNGLAAGDVNGDGWVDLAVAKWVNFESGIYLNTGAGLPAATPAWTVAATGTDRGAALGDVDGDGDLDPYFGGDPSVGFENQGMLAFGPAWANTDPLSGPQDFRMVDVDGDGDLDIAEIHFSTGRAYLYENTGGVISPTPAWSFDAPEVGTALAVGDLNGDGRADLALGFSGNTSVRVFFAPPPSGCPADLTGDGVADSGDLAAFIDAYIAGDVGVADLTGDGQIDSGDLAAFISIFINGC